MEDSYCNRAFRCSLPTYRMPEESMPRHVAYKLIEEELTLDGKPTLNLATFVTTECEEECEKLMSLGMKKNAIDTDEYPKVWQVQEKCVNMLARLFNAPLGETDKGVGTACIGSSEAIMLATLAMKWKWKERCKKQGRSVVGVTPNIVFGANVQVCWHKACRYFEIESREARVSPDSLVLTAERALPLIDENTIGVCPILGSTFNGEYEDVKGIHDMVQKLNAKNGWDVPLHVDAASGGFVAPFYAPELLWDFRLPGVKSINVSGHKFGLTYAGIGWILFREEADLHPDLVFHVNYLGGDQASFTLNFSKGSSTIIGQFYNLVRLGEKGYSAIVKNCMENASYIREELSKMDKINIVDKAHLPLVAWSLNDDSKFTVFDLQDKLRNKGWIVPAYTCPEGAEELAIMRVVVKMTLSRNLAEALVQDIKESMEWLEIHPTRSPDEAGTVRKRPRLADVVKATMIVHHLGHDASHRLSGSKTKGVC